MIQLAFEPAYDPFHSAFRMLRQVAFLKSDPQLIARAKVLDVFVAEPAKCLDIRIPRVRGLKASAQRAAACQHITYGHRPPTKGFYNRMSAMQDAAIETLVMKQMLDGDAFSIGKILLIEEMIPEKLMKKVNDANASQADLMHFLFEDLQSFPFEGRNGLKDLTGLGEYRYDVF